MASDQQFATIATLASEHEFSFSSGNDERIETVDIAEQYRILQQYQQQWASLSSNTTQPWEFEQQYSSNNNNNANANTNRNEQRSDEDRRKEQQEEFDRQVAESMAQEDNHRFPPVASAPPDAPANAQVVGQAFDSDPNRSKVEEEDDLVRAKLHTEVNDGEAAAEEDDSKPAAVASQEVHVEPIPDVGQVVDINDDPHPADLEQSVAAEFVQYDSPNQVELQEATAEAADEHGEEHAPQDKGFDVEGQVLDSDNAVWNDEEAIVMAEPSQPVQQENDEAVVVGYEENVHPLEIEEGDRAVLVGYEQSSEDGPAEAMATPISPTGQHSRSVSDTYVTVSPVPPRQHVDQRSTSAPIVVSAGDSEIPSATAAETEQEAMTITGIPVSVLHDTNNAIATDMATQADATAVFIDQQQGSADEGQHATAMDATATAVLVDNHQSAQVLESGHAIVEETSAGKDITDGEHERPRTPVAIADHGVADSETADATVVMVEPSENRDIQIGNSPSREKATPTPQPPIISNDAPLPRQVEMNEPATATATDVTAVPLDSVPIEDMNPMSFAHAQIDISDLPPIPPAMPVNPREEETPNAAPSRRNDDEGRRSSSESLHRSSTSGSNSSGGRRGASRMFSTVENLARGTRDVVQDLFGDNGRRRSLDFDGEILPRRLLPWSVFPSETTGMWVATVNTNQRALDSNNIAEASSSLRAFSVPTKKQAESLAKAWAPPRMLPFETNPVCFVCSRRFTLIVRACHCRNCGVCICSRCTVQWPSRSLPDTYNLKKGNTVNICTSCDWLSTAFRCALLEGDHDRAVALHASGNVNLVTQFGNVKGEIFYPVHCAVLGGNLKLLQWLVDEHCCPLRSIRISGRTRDSAGNFIPILTSKDRSLLGIAIEKQNVEMIRYLVVEKSMPLLGERNLNLDTVVRVLDSVLRRIPAQEGVVPAIGEDNSNTIEPGGSGLVEDPAPPQEAVRANSSSSNAPTGSVSSGVGDISTPDLSVQEDLPRTSSSARNRSAQDTNLDDEDEVEDPCKICCASSIDCVAKACGHQMCCLSCSRRMNKCPVCLKETEFMKIFR